MVLEVVKPGWVDGEDFPIFSVDIHPNGQKFATGGQGSDCGRIVIWNMEPIRNEKAQKDPKVPKQLCQMENHLACVNSVRWSGDGKYLASAGDDKLVMLWTKSAYGGGAVFGGGGKVNHENYKCSSTLRQHAGDVLDLSWSPDDRYLASCSVDNTVIVWDVTGDHPTSVAVLRGHSSHVKGVTWDPVGKYLASQSADKTLRIWRTSDWKEEQNIKEPFKECGGTTHVLRLNWSPDGQYIVSAHAMNSGGPTAQIIERDGFKYERDYVGHRKAVTCVRFNSNIFHKSSNTATDSNYVCVAIGSRDRSISVWLTCLRRPLLVLNDLFDSSVMDLAWSKDGMTLIACSHDGRIAGLNFTKADLGVPVTKSAKNELLKKMYGQVSGISVSNKPVLIENAELLNLNDNLEDMFDFTATSGNTTGESNSTWKTTANGTPIKGPTDKQIEVRTSDGRRRITPMFILPAAALADNSSGGVFGGDSQRNSCDSASLTVKFSSNSSTETKSKIPIEKRDVVVKPNVSPGKNNSNSNSLPGISSIQTNGTAATNGSNHTNGVEAAKSAVTNDQTPKANMIQIKRKVGTTMVPVSQPSKPPTQPTASSNTTQENGSKPSPGKIVGRLSTNANGGNKSPTKMVNGASKSDDAKKKLKEKEKEERKKKPNRIESSSSSGSSDSDSSDSSGSDSSDSEDSSDGNTTAASQTEKSGKEDVADDLKAKAKKMKAKLVGLKRKAEDSPQNAAKKKKLGLKVASAPAIVNGSTSVSAKSSPPASSSSTQIVEKQTTATVTTALAPPAAAVSHPQRLMTSPIRTPGLPPLCLSSNPFYTQLRTNQIVLHIQVKNDYATYSGGALHRVTAHTSQDSPLIWESLFTSPIAGCISGGELIILACRDASIHMFRPDGSRALAPITLPSPVHKLKDDGPLVAVITNSARMFVFNTEINPPNATVKNIEITPLNRHTSPRTSISISGVQFSPQKMPVLQLSDGSTHGFSDDLGCWVQLVPSRHALSLSSSFKQGPPSTLPLASLSPSPSGMTGKLDASVADSWTSSVIEAKLSSCIILKSPQEYKYWLLRLVKQLAAQGHERRLRSILQDLSRERCKAGSLAMSAQNLGLNRKELLKLALPLLGANLSLQRLYSELRNEEELKATNSVDLFA